MASSTFHSPRNTEIIKYELPTERLIGINDQL
jgi:hypothetical protein